MQAAKSHACCPRGQYCLGVVLGLNHLPTHPHQSWGQAGACSSLTPLTLAAGVLPLRRGLALERTDSSGHGSPRQHSQGVSWPVWPRGVREADARKPKAGGTLECWGLQLQVELNQVLLCSSC